ncbi:MAG: aspartate 1-decarboxylase [Opitutales bacterium]
MKVEILKSKLLRVKTTEVAVDYEGSLAIDSDLMKLVGILPCEKILVGNIASGTRFETYAIEAPAGSGTISIRGAAGHLGNLGDLLVIMSFSWIEEEEAKTWLPRTATFAGDNKTVIKQQNILK